MKARETSAKRGAEAAKPEKRQFSGGNCQAKGGLLDRTFGETAPGRRLRGYNQLATGTEEYAVAAAYSFFRKFSL